MTTKGRRYRRETLIALVEQIDITVPALSTTTLIRRSIAHYNRRNPTCLLYTSDAADE